MHACGADCFGRVARFQCQMAHKCGNCSSCLSRCWPGLFKCAVACSGLEGHTTVCDDASENPVHERLFIYLLRPYDSPQRFLDRVRHTRVLRAPILTDACLMSLLNSLLLVRLGRRRPYARPLWHVGGALGHTLNSVVSPG